MDEVAALIFSGDCQQARSCAAAINDGVGLVGGGGSGVSAEPGDADSEQRLDRRSPPRPGSPTLRRPQVEQGSSISRSVKGSVTHL